MPSLPSSPAPVITAYITQLRAIIALLQDESYAHDTLILDALLCLERMLDRGRVVQATYVPPEATQHPTSELHAELDALRAVIATRLQALPPGEAKSLLQSRVNEAGSSWWHLIQ
jgi:predicted component of type VI protein secretion system